MDSKNNGAGNSPSKTAQATKEPKEYTIVLDDKGIVQLMNMVDAVMRTTGIQYLVTGSDIIKQIHEQLPKDPQPEQQEQPQAKGNKIVKMNGKQ